MARYLFLPVVAVVTVLTVSWRYGADVLSSSPINDPFIDSLHKIATTRPGEVLQILDSIEIGSEIQPERLAALFQIRGLSETALGNVDEGLKNYIRAYEIFDSIGSGSDKINVLINISVNQSNAGNFLIAQSYLSRALEQVGSDSIQLAAIYVNLGGVYDQLGKPEEALRYYDKAVPLYKNAELYDKLALLYHNIAIVYGVQGDFMRSRSFELTALKYHQLQPRPETFTMITLTLGSLYLEMDSLLKAQVYLEMGGKKAEELKLPHYLKAYYQSMAELMETQNRYPEASQWLRRYIDELEREYASEKLALGMELERKFESDLKSKEIELLQAEAELKGRKIRENKIWKGVLIGGIGLMMVLGAVLYRNYRLKAKANALLERNKRDLEAENIALQNQNALVQFNLLRNQISPHFLFNSLNALASLISQDPAKAVKFTTAFSSVFRNTLEFKDRVLITLEEEIAQVKTYLFLQEMRFGQNLRTTFRIDSSCLAMFIPPFSLQLVVENAVKHNIISDTMPLTITIECTHGNLVIENDFQPRRSLETSTGTGISNIRSRYKYHTDTLPVFELRTGKWYVSLPLIPNS